MIYYLHAYATLNYPGYIWVMQPHSTYILPFGCVETLTQALTFSEPMGELGSNVLNEQCESICNQIINSHSDKDIYAFSLCDIRSENIEIFGWYHKIRYAVKIKGG